MKTQESWRISFGRGKASLAEFAQRASRFSWIKHVTCVQLSQLRSGQTQSIITSLFFPAGSAFCFPVFVKGLVLTLDRHR